MENSDNSPQNVLDMDDSEFTSLFGENPYETGQSIQSSEHKYIDASINTGNEVVPGMIKDPTPLDIDDLPLSSQQSEVYEDENDYSEDDDYPEYDTSEDSIEENYDNSGDYEEQNEDDSESPEPLYTIEDPESWFNAVTQPIEVNGVELTLNDPEIVRRLIVKGAESNLKNSNNNDIQNRILKSLEKYDIDEKALDLMIGAYQGDRNAISKIITRNAILLTDLNYTDFDDTYDKKFLVSPKEMEYENSISSLKNPANKEVIDDFFSTLDKSSQEQLKLNPKIYTAIESFMETGLHNKVLNQIARKKMAETYDYSLNDIANYEKNLLEIVNQEKQRQANRDFDDDDVYRDPRKSAGLSRNRSFSQTPVKNKEKPITTKDIINMSDDDFLQAFGKSY